MFEQTSWAMKRDHSIQRGWLIAKSIKDLSLFMTRGGLRILVESQ